jgi:hypothetical protein
MPLGEAIARLYSPRSFNPQPNTRGRKRMGWHGGRRQCTIIAFFARLATTRDAAGATLVASTYRSRPAMQSNGRDELLQQVVDGSRDPYEGYRQRLTGDESPLALPSLRHWDPRCNLILLLAGLHLCLRGGGDHAAAILRSGRRLSRFRGRCNRAGRYRA